MPFSIFGSARFGPAIDGREPDPGERAMTVRDMARRDDPDFDRHMQQKIASVGPVVQQGAQA